MGRRNEDADFFDNVSVTYTIYANPGSQVILRNNSDVLIDTGLNTLSFYKIDCDRTDRYIDFDPITKEPIETGCCS